MSAHVVVHVLLALQHAATDEQAEALLDQLADPSTRRLARKEWDALHAATVTTLETA